MHVLRQLAYIHGHGNAAMLRSVLSCVPLSFHLKVSQCTSRATLGQKHMSLLRSRVAATCLCDRHVIAMLACLRARLN
jgi:hypothetical protein